MTSGLSAVGQRHNGFANPSRSSLSFGIDHNNPLPTTRADLAPCSGLKLQDFHSISLPRQAQFTRVILRLKHLKAGGNGNGCRKLAAKSRS